LSNQSFLLLFVFLMTHISVPRKAYWAGLICYTNQHQWLQNTGRSNSRISAWSGTDNHWERLRRVQNAL